MTATKRTWLFLALAFAISWGLYAIARWVIGVEGDIGWLITSALFMFGPGIAACIVRTWAPALPWSELGVTWNGIRWGGLVRGVLLATLLVPLTLAFNALLGNGLGLHVFGHTELSASMLSAQLQELLGSATHQPDGGPLAHLLNGYGLPGWLLLLGLLLFGAIAGSTFNLVFALGEELGWRGLLFATTRRWGWLDQTVFTGVVWGLWHAPLILRGHNYPAHPHLGVLWMCGLTACMSVPLAWARLRGGCVWAAAAFHGTVNATAGATVLFTRGGDTLFGSPVGVSGMLALLVLSAAILVSDRDLARDLRAGA